MSRPTIRTVAEQAEVSVATVSYFLNNPARLSQATRDKVRAAVERLGYVSDQRARQLSTGDSTLIGLLVEDVENPFFGRLARGITEAARRRGYLVVLGSRSHAETSTGFYVEAFEQNRFSSVIFALAEPRSVTAEEIARLQKTGMKVGRVGSGLRKADTCSVSVDSRLGGRLAAEHLGGMGHRRIAVISPRTGYAACDERVAGFTSALDAFVDEVSLTRIDVADLSVQEGEDAFDAVRASGATAVFCVSDLLATGLVRRAIEAQIRVPDDLAVVGYDDMAYATATSPRLTSIHQPVNEIGEAIADLVIDEVAGAEAHEHVHLTFDPWLVIRDSSGIPNELPESRPDEPTLIHPLF